MFCSKIIQRKALGFRVPLILSSVARLENWKKKDFTKLAASCHILDTISDKIKTANSMEKS